MLLTGGANGNLTRLYYDVLFLLQSIYASMMLYNKGRLGDDDESQEK